ncbi:MAG: hypothetical protein ACJ71Q_07380 [Terriglobales bacterium]|jgi:hypothetical protein
MKSTDQEWRALRERYEEMSDDQLHELTCDAWQLTDIAREVCGANSLVVACGWN